MNAEQFRELIASSGSVLLFMVVVSRLVDRWLNSKRDSMMLERIFFGALAWLNGARLHHDSDGWFVVRDKYRDHITGIGETPEEAWGDYQFTRMEAEEG